MRDPAVELDSHGEPGEAYVVGEQILRDRTERLVEQPAPSFARRMGSHLATAPCAATLIPLLRDPPAGLVGWSPFLARPSWLRPAGAGRAQTGPGRTRMTSTLVSRSRKCRSQNSRRYPPVAAILAAKALPARKKWRNSGSRTVPSPSGQ